MITAIRVFLKRLFGKDIDPRLDEEIAAHLEMLAREFESKGMSPEEARAAARREFGPIAQMRESHRDRRRLQLFDSLFQDISYACRQLRANPGFTAAAIVTLALGIGANTAIFTVLDRIVIRSLPVADPDGLVAIRVKQQLFGVPLVREMSARQAVVQGIFATGGAARIRKASVQGREIVEPAFLLATGNYFRLLGTRAQVGRLFSDTDDDASAAPVAVISDRFWRRQFGGQSSVLGMTIRINEQFAVQVIGVTEHDFYGERLGQIPDAWIPLSFAAQVAPGMELRSSAWLSPMARLRADVPLEQAQAGLAVLLNQLMPDYGLRMRGVTDYQLQLVPARQGLATLTAEFSTPLWLLMGLVTFVVLITCCNLANLLLARGVARSHEIGVRLAIGASRARMMRQLLTESLVIAGLGGGLGLAIAYWGSRGLTSLAFAAQNQEFMMGLDWRVAFFAVLVSIVCACLFGLVPAFTTSRINLNSALQAAGRTHSGGRSRHVATKCFGAAQLGISMLLVAGALLFGNSFWNLLHQDMGFSRNGILTFRTDFDAASFTTFRNPVLRQALLDQLHAIPGIESAALLQGGPLDSVRSDVSIALPDASPEQTQRLSGIDVSARYFETMGIRILAGRGITDSDRADTTKVAVITQTAARTLFGTDNPLGKRFTNGAAFNAAEAIEVVGVAHDIRFSDLREPFKGIVFLPFTQVRPYTTPIFILKTGRNPMKFAEQVKQTVQQVAPKLRIERIQPWDEVVGSTVRNERLLAWLSAAFGALAIVLASVGMYGVVAYGAERSLREIGIRLALGAQPYQLRLMLLREITTMLVFGIAFGAAATLMLGQWIRAILFDLAPYDPITLIAAVLLLTAVVLFAGYLPARAARLDPLVVLRQQ